MPSILEYFEIKYISCRWFAMVLDARDQKASSIALVTTLEKALLYVSPMVKLESRIF